MGALEAPAGQRLGAAGAPLVPGRPWGRKRTRTRGTHPSQRNSQPPRTPCQPNLCWGLHTLPLSQNYNRTFKIVTTCGCPSVNGNLRFWKDDLPTATGSQDPDKACNPFTHPVASRPEPVSLWGSYSVNSPITEPQTHG